MLAAVGHEVDCGDVVRNRGPTEVPAMGSCRERAEDCLATGTTKGPEGPRSRVPRIVVDRQEASRQAATVLVGVIVQLGVQLVYTLASLDVDEVGRVVAVFVCLEARRMTICHRTKELVGHAVR